MGKSSINGPFSMAMLNNQRVTNYVMGLQIICNFLQTHGPLALVVSDLCIRHGNFLHLR